MAGNNPDGCQIGAKGVGCFNAPIIESVTDVGNDQGRHVRLIWNRSNLDEYGSPSPITEYGIYRRQDEFKSLTRSRSPATRMAGWDYILSVPARGDETYQTIVQ